MEPEFFLESDARTLACDRRSLDSDGRLTATNCVLTRANVCMYVGAEVVDWELLGLDPQRIYRLYREPVALKAATPGLNGKPLMWDHVAVSADDPQKQRIVGTVSECRWADDAIVGTVSIWDADAIRAVQSGALQDLSCAYRYRPIMKAGTTPSGEPYDGLMSSPIEFNHIAIVEKGRVEGAFVADAAPHRVVTLDEALRLARAPGKPSAFEQAVPGYGRLP